MPLVDRFSCRYRDSIILRKVLIENEELLPMLSEKYSADNPAYNVRPGLKFAFSHPAHKHLTVSKGDFVRKGQKLTEGSIVPHTLLEVCGIHELQRHLVDAIQLVYRAQGVEINDKHVEIIIRQMMQKVRITESGSTDYLPGEQLDRTEFDRVNREMIEKGGKPAEAEPILLGITKAALETESFISAASFQDTTRILTEA